LSQEQTQTINDDTVRVKYEINWANVREVEREHPSVSVSNKFLISVLSDELPGSSPSAIVYEDPSEDELNKWLSELPNYIEGLFTFNGEPLLLEDYQKNWVTDKGTYRWCGKSRRVGMSLICAAEALAEAQLTDVNKDWTFISYTMEEAINKIQYARYIYDAMPERFKRRKMRDRRQSLEFLDPISGTVTRLNSHAQRAPRGGGGSILFDELAHCQWARKLYEAGAACILTGDGTLTVISSPFGEGDLFHEIGTDNRKYKHYSRHWVYWWECTWLCKDVINARQYAPMMSTEERVEVFGNKKLKELFASYGDIDAFKQEMECEFLSEAYKFFPKALIFQCIFPWSSQRYIDESGVIHKFDPGSFDEDTAGSDMSDYTWVDYNDVVQPSAYKIVRKYHGEKGVQFFKCDNIDQFLSMYQGNTIGYNLLGGYDIGRKKDSSELSIFEELKISGGRTLKIERYVEQLKGTSHPEQKRYLFWVMNNIPSLRLQVDANGMGSTYYEELDAAFPGRVVPAYFETNWKSDTCKTFKSHLDGMSIAIAEDRASIDQIHSIRKTISPNMLELFHADKSEKEHHGDKFWAKAMAVNLGSPPETNRQSTMIDPNQQFDNSRLYAGEGGIIDMSSMTSRPRLITGRALSGVPYPVVNNGGPSNLNGLPVPFSISGLKSPEKI
jgi:phage FluMu gp28-like protein